MLMKISEAALLPDQATHALLPLVLDDIHLAFHGRVVFKGLNFRTSTAGITAVMGPNGAGKSVLLRVLAGLVQPDHGQVLYGNKHRLPAGALGFVFQRPVLLRRSVEGNLAHALRIAGVPKAMHAARTRALLNMGDLSHLADSPARKLSGGEQQRLALLRALACNPGLLLLDEPTASLDPQATVLIENLIRQVAQTGVKVVIVTHDAGQAARLACEVAFVHQGRVLELTPTPQFLSEPSSLQARMYLAGELLTH